MKKYYVTFQCVAEVKATSEEHAKDIVRRGCNPVDLSEPEILDVSLVDGQRRFNGPEDNNDY